MASATLAIHPGALGDVLLAIPALRALRAAGARLTLAAQPRIASLLVALDETDDGCDFESLRLDALFAGERGARLPAVERVVCWFGARDPDFARRLAAISPGAIVAASVDRGGLTPPSDTPGAPGRDVWRHLLATTGDARERRDVEIMVHEGPADAEPAARLLRLVPSARRLREPSLPALAGVLARCAAYVGNDSGVSHLAAAVGAPALLLFAAANLGWRPWAHAARVLTVSLERAEAGDVSEVRGALDAILG